MSLFHFVNGERAEPEGHTVKTLVCGKHTQQASWSFGLAHGVVELTRIQRQPQRDKGQRTLPVPESQQKLLHPPTRIPAALALPCATHRWVTRNACTPKMSGARRMNTLPFPSATELTCASCATLPRNAWTRERNL
jgi:hypothetical protein